MDSKLEKEVLEMRDYMEIESSDDPMELKQRILRIATYQSRIAFMLADAKKSLRAKKSAEISNTIMAIAKEACLSAKVQNAMLESICEEEQYTVDILDRLQSSCTHSIDGLRSVLSYCKEELNKLHNYQ